MKLKPSKIIGIQGWPRNIVGYLKPVIRDRELTKEEWEQAIQYATAKSS